MFLWILSIIYFYIYFHSFGCWNALNFISIAISFWIVFGRVLTQADPKVYFTWIYFDDKLQLHNNRWEFQVRNDNVQIHMWSWSRIRIKDISDIVCIRNFCLCHSIFWVTADRWLHPKKMTILNKLWNVLKTLSKFTWSLCHIRWCNK